MISWNLLKDIFGDNHSHKQYPLLLQLVQNEVGGNITLMEGQIERVGMKPGEYTSLGLLSVEGVETLLDVMDFTQNDNEIEIGYIEAENGDRVYMEDDIDKELAENVGGDILRDRDRTTLFQMSTSEVRKFNQKRAAYDNSESLAANAEESAASALRRGMVSERVEDRAANVADRLENIPDSSKMPDPEDMTIGSAKEFSLGIVFVDIAGFSDYAQRNTEEDVLFMLNLLIPEIMATVRDAEGDFEKNTGDGILAYFGAGESDRQTAHDVLTYVATIKTVLADYINPTLEDNGVEPVSIKVGAAMGDVHISRIGVDRLNRRTVVGETANIASKLEDEAGKHEFFISEEIHESVTNGTECGWAPGLDKRGTLAGFERDGEPVNYYNFLGFWEDTETDNFVR